jgi:hypothetical protein|tara:strand:- start:71 stop:5074 length:5004 start_codon:yes stop_codon:yes gene_type:complete
MKAVKKNTFYKSTTLTAGAQLTPSFPDLPRGGGSTSINLQGGFKETLYALSGALPSTPQYGESKLEGGTLSVYCEDIKLVNTPTLPQLQLYKFKPNISISEGTLQPAFLSGNSAYNGINSSTNSEFPDGTTISVYTSLVDSENYYAYETFDGSDKTLGDIKIIKSAGTGVVELSDAYLSVSVAKNKATGKAGRSGDGKYQQYSLETYFADNNAVIPIKPESDDINGVWRPQIDKRKTRKKKLVWRKPYWKYKNIKGNIQFRAKAGVGTDMDASNTATKGTTIFDEVYATADTNNPFTSDTNNPLMMTTCELSTAKKYSGGQAFRMYHLWDYSAQSANLQRALGSKAIMPSMTRASIYNLPLPHPGLDNAYEGTLAGDNSKILPEISMRMNISKLGFTPYLSKGTQGFSSGVTFYPSGSGNAAAGAAGTSSTYTSLMRSVVVTWSNYKPKADHVTVDKFIEYGLERFYTNKTTENIVGGIAFFKTGIDGPAGSDPSTIMASALPVTAWKGTDGTLPTSTTVLVSGGLAKFSGLGSGLGSTMLLGCDKWTDLATNGPRFVKLPMDSWFNMRAFIDGYAPNQSWPVGTKAGSAQTNVYYKSSYIAADITDNRLGVPMRVFFEADLNESGSTSDPGNTDVPFVDVYFPGGDDSTVVGAVAKSAHYTFLENPEYYPKYMTIWMQNYRWIEAANNDSSTDQTRLNTSAGVFQFGDNGGVGGTSGPLPNGSAIEAELYVDDIILKNFVPDITNCSAGASVATQNAITLRDEAVMSPYTEFKFPAGTSGLTAGATVRGWATGTSATGATGYGATGALNDVTSTECIVFGFDDHGQLPIGPTAGNSSWSNRPTDAESWGFMLGSGFHTMLYSSMQRLKPSAFISSWSNTRATAASDYNQVLGGQFKGEHSYAGVDSALIAETTAVPAKLNSVFSHTLFTTNDASDITSSEYSTNSNSLYFTKGQINYMTYNELPTTSTSTMPSSMDGFTSKGLMRIYVSGTDVSTYTGPAWVKREHIMASTKITGIAAYPPKNMDSMSVNQITVQDPTIFNKYQDDEFIIYRIGKGYPTGESGSANTKGWGIHANSTSIKLDQEVSIDSASKLITLNVDLTTSDDGSTALLTEANLSELWISPKKYWITLHQPANKTIRSYSNFLMVQDVGGTGTGNVNPITATAMSGSTWSEFVYGYDKDLRGSSPATDPTDFVGQASLNKNQWNLDQSTTLSSLVTNKDYGYGVYDEETQEGGEVSQATALIDEFVYFDLDGVAKDKGTAPDENLVFLMSVDDGGLEQVLVSSDEHADLTKRPTMYWEFKDEIPKITTPINLSPNFNILSGSGENKVDLYKLDREDLNALKFTWGEEADDIVYRLLYIDSSPIQNKYHQTAFQAPLNELPAAGVATGSYYTGSSRNVAGTFNTSTKRTITGSSGWAYDGNLATSTSAVDWPQVDGITGTDRLSYFGNSEATFVVHAVPRDGTTQTQGTLFTDNSTRGAFKIYYTKAASANADVTPVVSLTSGSTVVSGKTVTLTSDYSFPNDGESPLFVVVTFNANLDSNHIKMYVNGRLVKQSAGNWTKGNNLYDSASYDGKINIGNEADTGGTKKFRGTIQECIIHNKELYVPTAPTEYKLSTEFLPDKTAAGGTAVKYNARLFLFDYHNIIGTSRDTVCSSDEVSWEATPI